MRRQTHDETPAGHPAGVSPSRTTRAGALLVLVWLVLVGTRWFVVDWYSVPSESMSPTLRPGERIAVDRLHRDVHRGDVVVLDGASFGLRDDRAWPWRVLGAAVGEAPGQHLVKRVVAVGGNHLRCCDDTGRLVLDGTPLDEPYVAPGDTPSQVRFDVTIPPGTLWVMGDRRSRSADSRSRLGRPGGGFVPVRDVTGRVVQVLWPPSAWQDPLSPSPSTTTGGDR